MPDFTKLLQEWAVISSAPISFVAAAVILGGIIWGVVNWSYSSVLSNKNAQIDLLKERIAAYESKLKVASPEQAVGELQSLKDQLAETKKKLAEIVNPPRDQNSVYQNGRRIGIVAGVQIEATKQEVAFQQMTVGGELDQATNVEFRNLILSYRGSDAIGQARQGLSATTTYHNARFAIVGNRSD